MGVQITPKDYQHFKAQNELDNLSREDLIEYVKLYRSNFVYFANCNIIDNTIEHHRITSTEPAEWGTILRRNIEFISEYLVLSPKEILWEKQTRLWWKKI